MRGNFADQVGVSLETVTNWEKGKTETDVIQHRKIRPIPGIPMNFIFVR